MALLRDQPRRTGLDYGFPPPGGTRPARPLWPYDSSTWCSSACWAGWRRSPAPTPLRRPRSWHWESGDRLLGPAWLASRARPEGHVPSRCSSVKRPRW